MRTYTIKDLETISGIKAHTLRIWEQRYNLLIPKRTPTNIRYYTDEDLRFILNVSILNNYGLKISEIVKMSPDKISELVLLVSENNSPSASQIQALVSSMFSLDEEAFNRILANTILRGGLEKTMVDLVFPFLQQIGVLWMTGSVHPAHEHFITNLIKQKLYVAIDGQTNSKKANSKKFLLFLPQGEPHEIGLLFANYILRSRGHEVVYLGQNVPQEELAKVLSIYTPDYIFTVLTSGMNHDEVQDYIDAIQVEWSESEIWLSGYLVINHPGLKLKENVKVLRSVQELVASVDDLKVEEV